MSTSVVFEQPQKIRAELKIEWASLDQKIRAMKEDMKRLEEQVTAKLEEKVKAKRAELEKLESEKKDLEKILEELQENQEPSSGSNEPISEVAERKEEHQVKTQNTQLGNALTKLRITFQSLHKSAQGPKRL